MRIFSAFLLFFSLKRKKEKKEETLTHQANRYQCSTLCPRPRNQSHERARGVFVLTRRVFLFFSFFSKKKINKRIKKSKNIVDERVKRGK